MIYFVFCYFLYFVISFVFFSDSMIKLFQCAKEKIMCQSKCFTKLENGINYMKFEGEITKIRKKRNIKVMFLKLKRFKIPKKGLIKKNVS